MIQELFGGCAGVLGGADQRKVSINCGVRILEGSSISNSSHPSTTSTTNTSSSTATAAAATNTNSTTFNTSSSSSDNQQNLRCPRCDSANTKFCYYNNYNLTQPRHFCKTCRRYWTKGGALRNVPIGGGCRKNKSSIVSTTTAGKAAASSGKIRTASPDIVKSSLGFGFDNHDPPSNPILWSSSQPQNSQLLALLRATQNPNPNPMKEEGNMNIGSHMISDTTGAALNARSGGLSLDPTISHVPFSLCSSFWRNNQHQTPQQHHHHHQQQQGFLVGEVQNTGNIQELYQRLRSSANYYSSDHSPSVLGNVATTSANSSSIFEPAATVAGGDQLGYWNPSFSWPNLSTTNGAFP